MTIDMFTRTKMDSKFDSLDRASLEKEQRTVQIFDNMNTEPTKQFTLTKYSSEPLMNESK